jgi:dTMP kinase
MFVTVEGVEGSGKSTLLAGLAVRLRASGHDVVVTREPGGTPVGEALREILLEKSVDVDPMAEAFMMNASRAQLVAEVIRPALTAGKTVLCDRFADSTLAYQGYGRGLDLATLRAMCDAATGGLKPERVFVLDLPYDVSRARMRVRAKPDDRIEREDHAFFDRARNGFLELAKVTPAMRVLDGTRPLEELLKEAMSEIETARE